MYNAEEIPSDLFNIVKNVLISKEVVFFGSYAILQYSKYMPKRQQNIKVSNFDVLSLEPEKVAMELKGSLNAKGFDNVNVKQFPSVGEIVSSHFQVIVDQKPIVFVYFPLACHSYNRIREVKKWIKIATIETMMSFYLAFLYTSRTYYNKERTWQNIFLKFNKSIDLNKTEC